MFFYFGDENSQIFNYLRDNYWLKDTTLPIYQIHNLTLVEDNGCKLSNKTERNFMFVYAKNSTYDICFSKIFENLEESKTAIEYYMKENGVVQ